VYSTRLLTRIKTNKLVGAKEVARNTFLRNSDKFIISKLMTKIARLVALYFLPVLSKIYV